MIKFIMNWFCGDCFKHAQKYWEHYEQEQKRQMSSIQGRLTPGSGIPACVKFGNPKRYGYNGSWRKYV